jgi:hypothetical protein
MRIAIRKCILWFYVFLVTIILGAVFVIGCSGSGGTESGGHNDLLGECSFCSSTSQCDTGWSCINFTDHRYRCGRLGYTTCNN